MSEQGGLFDDAARKTSVRFREFHKANPHVYDELVNLCRRARAAGRDKIGVRMLWERMRWTFAVETVRDEGEPKLNNDFTSRYARMIMEREPDLCGLFELRELRSS